MLHSIRKYILALAFGSTLGGVNALAKAPLDTLLFNNISAVYDELNDMYLLPMPIQYERSNQYRAKITYKTSTTGVKLYFDNKEIADGDSVTFSAPLATRQHQIVARQGNVVLFATTLSGTFLPIVELTTASNINGNTYTQGGIRVIDPNASTPSQEYVAKLRYRGATARTKQKKAFAVKLTDASGASVDGAFFGLRSDNNWILDAMAIDKARMRNRVSTDLWNDFSTKPYYQAYEKKAIVNGTRGHFVEMLLDGKYHGIYCMTEKVDRKQLRLKKSSKNADGTEQPRGLLYKTKQWSYAVLMGHDIDKEVYPGTAPVAYNNNLDTWNRIEMSYPEVADGQTITWEPLYNAITYVASNDTATFAEKAAELFDLPVALDYYLFIELMLATDNHGKNMFYSVYDRKVSNKIGITPWDLDGTWGRDYYSYSYKTANAAQDFITYLWKYEHGEHTLFKRLRETKQLGWEARLKARYAELRQTYFHPDSLVKRFTDYGDLFSLSGADVRERKRWSGSDNISINLPSEVAMITAWIPQRVAFLDKQYGYDPTTTSLSAIQTRVSNTVSCVGVKGAILLQSDQPQQVNIYTLTGKLIASPKISSTLTTVENLSAGIYLVGRQKVVVQ